MNGSNLFTVLVSLLAENPTSFELLNAMLPSSGLRSVTVIFSPDELASTNFSLSLQNYSFPLVLLTRNSPVLTDKEEVTSAVVILDESLSVEFIIRRLRREHRTIFIGTTANKRTASKLFTDFWNHDIISAYLYYEGALHGFEPSDGGIIVVETKKGKAVEVMNTHGSRVNVSVINLPPFVILGSNPMEPDGTEGKLMVEVAKAFNMKPRFAKARDGELWGWTAPKPTGVVGEVMSEYSHFGTGVLAITPDRYQVMDQVVGYSPMECLTWAVPKGAGHPGIYWLSILLTEFDSGTWTALICCSVLLTIFYCVMDRLALSKAIMELLTYSLGNSPAKWPSKKSSSYLITGWIWGTMVLSVAYTATMGSKLAVPPPIPDINFYSELLASSLQIYGHGTSLRLVSCDITPIQAIVNRSSVLQTTPEKAMERMLAARDNALMRQSSTFKHLMANDHRLRDNIHLMKDCAISYHSVIALKKLSPFYLGTRLIARRMFESGIMRTWEERLMFSRPSIERPKIILNFDDVFGAFVLFGAGLLLSVLTYFFEALSAPLSALSGPKKKTATRPQDAEWQKAMRRFTLYRAVTIPSFLVVGPPQSQILLQQIKQQVAKTPNVFSN